MSRVFSILMTWDLLRWLRLGLGAMILFEAFKTYDWFMGILGIVLIAQAVFNVGCCGTSGCSPSPQSPNQNQNKDVVAEKITYEEVK